MTGAVALARTRPAVSAFLGTAGVNGLILAFGLLTGIISARLLGPDDRGEFLVVLLWSGVISNFALLGLDQALIFGSSGSLGRGLAYASALRRRVAVQGALGFVLAFVVNLLLLKGADQQVVAQAALGALVVPLNAATQLRINPLLAGGRYTSWNLIRLASPSTYLLGLGALAVLDEVTVTTGLAVLAGGSAASSVLAVWHARLPKKSAGFTPDVPALVRYGRGTVLVTLSYQVATQVDQLILGAFAPAASLGIYAVAVSVVSALDVIRLTADQFLFPRYAARGWIRSAIRRNSMAAAALVALIGLSVLPFARAAIELVYGGDYVAAVDPLRVLLAAGACRIGIAVLGAALRASGHLSMVTKTQVLGIAVSIAALIVLLPRYGVMGAAISVLLSQFVCFAVLFKRIPDRSSPPGGSEA
ncbi:MAG: polysaccharide biosynthesis C-terminal domain-containing protein [Nocardioides sp.]|uniref:lipopolysaccharide biosynthesis protein n=1 Tax=Nocardioides sp. TaxID=35761 RepID=UPI0039E2998A